MIHPRIQEMTAYSLQWRKKANELLYQHVHSERILKILDNPEISKMKGKKGDYPNCFGTMFWTIGIQAEELPEYVFDDEVMQILQERGFGEISEKDLPTKPIEDIVFIEEMVGQLRHGAVYLGKANVSTIFEQQRTGGSCRITPVFGYMGVHRYFIRG